MDMSVPKKSGSATMSSAQEDDGSDNKLSRREVVGKLAVGAAGAAVALAAIGGRANAVSRGIGANTPSPAQRDWDIAPMPSANEASAPQAVESNPLPAIEASAPVVAQPPWELLRPLAIGSVVAHGWRVAELTGALDGSCVLTLQNDRGRTHRVHLCRNDGRPQGLVYTDRLDLVVMNGGQGDIPTDEGLAQAVAEVAHVLAVNERDRQQDSVVVALLPHEERLRLFPEDARLR